MSNDFQSGNLWGIDLGGTKVEGVILRSAHDPEVLYRHRLSTGAHLGYEHIVNQIANLVGHMKETAGLIPDHIGFATPGIRDPKNGTMKNCNSTALNGRFLKEDLEQKLSVRVTLANDANCFALQKHVWAWYGRNIRMPVWYLASSWAPEWEVGWLWMAVWSAGITV